MLNFLKSERFFNKRNAHLLFDEYEQDKVDFGGGNLYLAHSPFFNVFF